MVAFSFHYPPYRSCMYTHLSSLNCAAIFIGLLKSREIICSSFVEKVSTISQTNVHGINTNAKLVFCPVFGVLDCSLCSAVCPSDQDIWKDSL